MRLNLGSGPKSFDGFISVDKHPYEGVEQVVDLESLPWPWEDDSVEEIIWFHSLEHCGQTPDKFLGIMKEMYRVCQNDATVHIVVPHYRHADFAGDPTHVRVILPETIAMFSKENNDWVKEHNGSNTRFAHLLGVDFKVTHVNYALDDDFAYLKDDPAFERMVKLNNGIIKEIQMTVKVIKPQDNA